MSLRRRRVLGAIVFLAAAALVGHRVWKRPRSLPLATMVDGPAPAQAAGVIFFLHGRSGGLRGRTRALVDELRGAGLPADVSVVLIEGPFSTWFGSSWGDDTEAHVESRARVRAVIHDLLGEHGPPRARIVIAGFSQGAGLAADLAVEEPAIGALASFSPCAMQLRGALPERNDLRVLLAHGRSDPICPVIESRSLAGVLEKRGAPVRYIEFDGGHVVPPEVVQALVALASPPLSPTIR
jgi:phospholipase/carboxylesterase